MFSFFGSNRRRQAQSPPAPPVAQNPFTFAQPAAPPVQTVLTFRPPALPDPPRRRLPKTLPRKLLNHAQSVYHARVRCKALRRIFREKLEGSLCDLPKQDDMEKEALKEADKEIFFHLRKELFEEVLDIPEPVMRTIFDFQDPEIDMKIVPDLTSEAMSFETEVYGELARMLKKSIKKLAKKTLEDNIDELRMKLQGTMRKIAIAGHHLSSNSISIDCTQELNSLLAFNEELTQKMFTSGIEDALCKQWPEFGFNAFIHRSHFARPKPTVDISLKPPKRRSRARLDDVIARFDPPPTQSMDNHSNLRRTNQHNAFEFVNFSGFQPCNNCCLCRFHNLKK